MILAGAALVLAFTLTGASGNENFPPPSSCLRKSDSPDGPYSDRLSEADAAAIDDVMKRAKDAGAEAGAEYRSDRELVTKAIRARQGPVKLLVFGTGFDSRFWKDLVGPDGRCTFLESNKRFVAIDPGLDAHLVKYHSAPIERAHELVLLNDTAREAKLAIDGGPPDLWTADWDIILIDAPKGFMKNDPGRMAPIYHASNFIRGRRGGPCHPIDVFVHDSQRVVEREWGIMFLAPYAHFMNYKKLVVSEYRHPGKKTKENMRLFELFAQFPDLRMAWYHSP